MRNHTRPGRRSASLGRAVLLPVCLVVSCAGPSPPYDGPRTAAGDPPPPARAFDARVERVVDGDTFIAVRAGRRLRVRLIGVDAPESVQPGVPVECHGRASARALRRMLPAGLRVRAAYQSGGRRDRYDRELWDVWLADGRFVQAELVRSGAAEARAYPPQTDHAARLETLERVARRAAAGLWRAC